jgi:hypothetical protein
MCLLRARAAAAIGTLALLPSLGCGNGGSAGGTQQPPGPDAGEPDTGEPDARADAGPDPDAGGRPDARRIFEEIDAGSDCGDVPTQGRCKGDRAIESCFVPEALAEGDPLLVVTVECDPGEHCVADKFGARCEPDAACVSGQTECVDATSLNTCVDGVWQTTHCAACLQGADLGAACAGQAPSGGAITVRGRLLYEYRKTKPDLSGLEPTPSVEGAVGLVVHIVDNVSVVGVGETFGGGDGKAPGEFQIEIMPQPTAMSSIQFYPIDRDPKGRPRLGVAVAAQPEQQNQLSNSYHSWRMPLCKSAEACAGNVIDLGDILIPESELSGAIHVFQWLNYGLDQLRTIYKGVPQQSVVAFWYPTNSFNCGACYLGRQYGGAKVFPGGPRVDRYDTSIALSGIPPHHALRSVIAHELGHHVMATYSAQTFEGGPHGIESLAKPGLAWSEGWATFYGQALVSEDLWSPDPIHFSVSKNPGNPAFWGDLDKRQWRASNGVIQSLPAPNPVGPIDQKVNEIMVGSIVWSLWARGRAQTPQGLGDQPIFQALSSRRLTEYNRGYETPDLIDFLDALACSNNLYVPAIVEVVAAAGFPWRPEESTCAP